MSVCRSLGPQVIEIWNGGVPVAMRQIRATASWQAIVLEKVP